MARRRGRLSPGARRGHLVQAGDRRRGHRRGEMTVTCCPLRLARSLPGCQRRKPASAMSNAMNIRCAERMRCIGGREERMSTVKETGTGRPGAPGSKPVTVPDAKDDLKSLPVPEGEKRLGSSPDGLTGAEATERLTRYGPNEIAEKKDNPLLKLLTYFWGPIPWMIEAAVILSGVLRHWPDFFIILLLLVANAAVGFWEEHQAGKAIDALKAQLAVKCRVRRDGTWVTPPSRELVPGDVIRMRTGDIVPADARLLDGDPVQVDQSALTGESLPVSAGPGDAVYSGSVIKQGEAGALVYATGTGTYFGKT